MAPNIAAILTQNSYKIIIVLSSIFLEWILILLLLSNSFFSYIITKFAAYFNLKQPCILCSRLDHLIEPSKTADFYKSLVCDIHATQISNLGYCPIHHTFAELQQMCEECFPKTPKNVPFCAFGSNEKFQKCLCCEKILGDKLDTSRCFTVRDGLVISDHGNHSGSECEHQIISDVGSFYLRETAEGDSSQGDQVEDHAVEKQMEHSRSEDKTLSNAESHFKVVEFQHTSHLSKMLGGDHDVFFTLKQLKLDLEAEQKARNELYAELEAERNAAAIAANQTMAMITRLQEEKAATQMEALHYQRVMDEQSEYDQEALNVLNESVSKLEKEKEELEKELGRYRERVLDYEAKEKAMMLIQKCSENISSSCSIDNDSDVLSIDLNKDTSLMECSKQWGAIEDSLEELEEERMSIIKQLKELEEKLRKSAKQDDQNLLKESEPNADLCSQEVNLVSCFPTCLPNENHPKTMASVARKLLDLVESDDDIEREDMGLTNEVGFDRETENKRVAMEKEMNHVYGRLQALEADTEFLRHCIGSVNKGNEGLSVLQEILQHLRELRDAEICL
ncbi:unnamed protein product [Amaranthus hypochondriacus]